jgi:GNAT superfamily N-acetyltransferase
MEKKIENLTSPGLIEALEANMAAFWKQYGDAANPQLSQRTDLVRVMTGIPDPLFNGVFSAHLSSATVEAAIEEIHLTAVQWKLPLFWWLGPTSEPADLGDRLIKHGFVHAGAVPGLAVALAQLDANLPLPPGFTIEMVGDPEQLDVWANTVAVGTGFSTPIPELIDAVEQQIGLPPATTMRRYLGRLNGSPVAGSAMVLNSGVAGIFAVATLPAARGQGVGAAMTLLPLLDALHEGYKVGTLQASAMGYPVYRRLGFQDVCKIELYLLPIDSNSNG